MVEDNPEGVEGVLDHPGGLEVVGTSSRRSGSGRRPSWRSGTGRETPAEVLKWLGDTP